MYDIVMFMKAFKFKTSVLYPFMPSVSFKCISMAVIMNFSQIIILF